ncbi:phage portal protein [Rothia nasimurium]|uniref:Phage portal protein n=1 Tax=Rothia nasimurium TaxID=85336 RepID=A0A4Y9F1H5_9MICC|nr:phage portal protein [Rothia nasimurium]MBF0809181.1 phage portal protein [Rothia nasimurium]TFU20530.1 phage portal protein [Rothia nasimurium]
MSHESMLEMVRTPPKFDIYENYYSGEVNLQQLGISLPPEARVLEMSVMWPKLAIDVLVESLVLEGFTVGEGAAPDEIHRIFQANNFDTKWPLAMTEALVQRRSYVVVGGAENGSDPLISVHSPKGFAVRRDHFGRIVEALRKYKNGSDEYTAHYLPGVTTWRKCINGKWAILDSKNTGLDRVPVVELTNRVRAEGDGYSELEAIADICDAASRSLINLQVAQEMLSMPLRYLFGDGADEEKIDQFGNAVSKLDVYWGHLITGPAGSSAGSLDGASLEPIISAFKLYAQQVSAMTGIPPFMLGITADSNPTSAEAMQVAKDRLVTRAMQKQNLFGDAAEDIARLCLEAAGHSADGLETLEARWRDPSVASPAARNAQILQAQAQGIITKETAREFLGLSPEQLARENIYDTNSRAVLGQ